MTNDMSNSSWRKYLASTFDPDHQLVRHHANAVTLPIQTSVYLKSSFQIALNCKYHLSHFCVCHWPLFFTISFMVWFGFGRKCSKWASDPVCAKCRSPPLGPSHLPYTCGSLSQQSDYVKHCGPPVRGTHLLINLPNNHIADPLPPLTTPHHQSDHLLLAGRQQLPVKRTQNPVQQMTRLMLPNLPIGFQSKIDQDLNLRCANVRERVIKSWWSL